MRETELLPGGAALPVRGDNRAQYVDLYTRWLLQGAVEAQFLAFQRGLRRLCRGPALALLRAEELEQLICGDPVLDFDALEAAATYEDGYSADCPHIRWFWRARGGPERVRGAVVG